MDGLTGAAAICATVLIRFQRAGERCSDQFTLQLVRRRRHARRDARRLGKHIYKLQDEVAWECAAQVGDTARVSLQLHQFNVVQRGQEREM